MIKAKKSGGDKNEWNEYQNKLPGLNGTNAAQELLGAIFGEFVRTFATHKLKYIIAYVIIEL